VFQGYGEKLANLGGGIRELLTVAGHSLVDFARRELGDAAYAAAAMRGEQLTTDELVDYVLAELRRALEPLSSPSTH
jgi:hypothetical protein